MSDCELLRVSPSVTVRDATASDNAALRSLDEACGMGSGAQWAIRHEPDFFALFREAGVPARVGVATSEHGTVVGSVTMVAARSLQDGTLATVPYVSGLHVHPMHRGRSVAPALARWAFERCLEEHRGATLGWFVGAGSGQRLRTLLQRLCPGVSLTSPRTLRSYWMRTRRWHVPWPVSPYEVRPAVVQDLDDMAALWHDASRQRQLAPELDVHRLARWQRRVFQRPPACYWVVRTRRSVITAGTRPHGALLGFVGLWDQRSVKQFQFIRERPIDTARRMLLHTVRPQRFRTARQEVLTARCLAATHVCVPGLANRVSELLFAHAARAARRAGYSHIAVMADDDDPAAAVCRPWRPRSQRFAAFLVGAPGATVRHGDDRPLHLDIGLA